MKRYSILALLFFGIVSSVVLGQTVVPKTLPTVREGDFTFIKKLKPTGNGLVMDIRGDPEAVTDMLTQRLEEATGGKLKSFKKGIMGIEGAVIEAISGNTFDYYFRVDDLKEEGSPRSQVTFFASVGNYNFLDSGKYPIEMENCKTWLQGLWGWKRLKEIAIEEAAQQTKLAEAQKQQQALEETEAKLTEEKTKLADELSKLQERINVLNEKVASNDEALAKHQKTKAEQLKAMEEMRAQLQKLINERISLQQ